MPYNDSKYVIGWQACFLGMWVGLRVRVKDGQRFSSIQLLQLPELVRKMARMTINILNASTSSFM